MKILILTNHDLGLYKYRKELLELLVKDNEVFVSLPIGKFTQKIKDIGCKYIDTEFDRKSKNPLKDISLYLEYRRIIRSVNPDVVLTYTIKPNIYGGLACQRTGIPYIVNITGLGTAIENGGFLSVLSMILYKLGLKKANKIFFQNIDNKNFMMERGIKNNTELIPGSGVNLEQYKLLPFPDDTTIEFAYVGRIMKEKGFNQYIDACKLLKSKYKNVLFHVCGPYEDDYKSIINDLIKDNIIVYDGYIDDMTTIYKKVQCIIHPTYYPEGLSNVLLECSASGRAMITTNRAGCKEVIEDGFNGFVVKEKDSNDLVEKINKFISLSNDERKKMGINARKKVELYFDRNIVINKYIESIKEAKK